MPVIYTDINGSTAIQRIGYDTVTTELRIVFVDKQQYPEYIWGGVENELVKAFFLAPSKGKFYHQYLKDNPRYVISRTLGSYRLSSLGRGTQRRVTSALKRTGSFFRRKT